MKKLIFLSLLCLAGNLTFAQKKIYPLIKSGGGMFEVPEATPVVDKKMQYKIIVDLSKASDKPDSVNSALDKLARLVNAHIEAGVPKENLSVIGVIHFLGTPMILEDEAYKKKFGMVNPNTALINELGKNGVRCYVCGQSLRARKLVDEKRNEHIKVAQSALITFSTFQNMGYSLILP
jgi:intracellular sulfur oxidation DsrE/DsrF family protein